VLETLPLGENSDDFVFDNQIVAQAVAAGFRVGEISCPTRYFAEASSINFARSIAYGFGVLAVSVGGFLHRAGLYTPRFLRPGGRLRRRMSARVERRRTRSSWAAARRGSPRRSRRARPGSPWRCSSRGARRSTRLAARG
jgi:hypothetical protein